MWAEEILQEALHELDLVPSATIRGVAKIHGLEESAIMFQLMKRKANLQVMLYFDRSSHHGVFCKIYFLKILCKSRQVSYSL